MELRKDLELIAGSINEVIFFYTIQMRQSRSVSPMPDNIGYLRDTLPAGARLNLYNGNAVQPFFYRALNDIRKFVPKLLLGGGGLYGAYKLGQYHDAIANKFGKFKSMFSNQRSNYTRSHA